MTPNVGPSLGRRFSGSNSASDCAVQFQDRILRLTVPSNFRVKSCVWLCRRFSGSNPASGYAVQFQGRILRLAVPCNFRVESCVWLCRGISGSNLASEAPNVILSFCLEPDVTLRFVPRGHLSWAGYEI